MLYVLNKTTVTREMRSSVYEVINFVEKLWEVSGINIPGKKLSAGRGSLVALLTVFHETASDLRTKTLMMFSEKVLSFVSRRRDTLMNK